MNKKTLTLPLVAGLDFFRENKFESLKRDFNVVKMAAKFEIWPPLRIRLRLKFSTDILSRVFFAE